MTAKEIKKAFDAYLKTSPAMNFTPRLQEELFRFWQAAVKFAETRR